MELEELALWELAAPAGEAGGEGAVLAEELLLEVEEVVELVVEVVELVVEVLELVVVGVVKLTDTV